MSWEELTIENTDWCYLYKIYDFKTGDLVTPGVQGMYSAETEDGIPYLATTAGHDQKTGKPMIMRDAELSMVYPVRVFVSGSRGERDLDWEDLRARLRELEINSESWEPVLLHRGYAKGKATWRKALRSGTDFGPRIHAVRKALSTHMNGDLPNKWEMVSDRAAEYFGNCEGVCLIELAREFNEDKEVRELARRIGRIVYANTETFGEDRIGEQLSYLLLAILEEEPSAGVEWEEDEPLLKLLKRLLQAWDPVWKYVKIKECENQRMKANYKKGDRVETKFGIGTVENFEVIPPLTDEDVRLRYQDEVPEGVESEYTAHRPWYRVGVSGTAWAGGRTAYFPEREIKPAAANETQ